MIFYTFIYVSLNCKIDGTWNFEEGLWLAWFYLDKNPRIYQELDAC